MNGKTKPKWCDEDLESTRTDSMIVKAFFSTALEERPAICSLLREKRDVQHHHSQRVTL